MIAVDGRVLDDQELILLLNERDRLEAKLAELQARIDAAVKELEKHSVGRLRTTFCMKASEVEYVSALLRGEKGST